MARFLVFITFGNDIEAAAVVNRILIKDNGSDMKLRCEAVAIRTVNDSKCVLTWDG